MTGEACALLRRILRPTAGGSERTGNGRADSGTTVQDTAGASRNNIKEIRIVTAVCCAGIAGERRVLLRPVSHLVFVEEIEDHCHALPLCGVISDGNLPRVTFD